MFDPSKEYGEIYPDIPVEAVELLAREFLPKGTPFMVLRTSVRGDEQLAWYYSEDGSIPNADQERISRVELVKECIS